MTALTLVLATLLYLLLSSATALIFGRVMAARDRQHS